VRPRVVLTVLAILLAALFLLSPRRPAAWPSHSPCRKRAAWDGSITATGAQILALEGWRFAKQDSTDGRATWKITTRYGPGSGGNQGSLMENSILAATALQEPPPRFSVQTIQPPPPWPA